MNILWNRLVDILRASMMLGFFMLLLNISGFISAKDKSVGFAVRVIGDVSATDSEGVHRKLKLRQPVYSGDTLLTSENGWLTINFYDLTRIVLRPDSEFEINEFPATIGAGQILLNIKRGGVRVISGTIASQSQEHFSLWTPGGELKAGRAEWVVRICDGEACNIASDKIKQCAQYQVPETANKQIISVYNGSLSIEQCPAARIDAGSSLLFSANDKVCEVVDQVLCFMLFDGKMGRDKLRMFKSKLILFDNIDHDENESDKAEERPESRQSRPGSRTRRPTRIDRRGNR